MNKEKSVIKFNQQAENYLSQGKLEAAYTICQRILTESPNFAPAYNTQGKVLQAMGKIESAIASYRQAIKLNPQQIETYTILGDIFV
ncbi:MAG: tetratricopeptide repeat protein, partial [Okeania sp. SIO3C4]|nr:tetratricopeptide repeat protein [Okeania sp. SIO3C4]